MKKLQNKIFILLISTLSLFLIIILIVLNTSTYFKEKNNITDKIMRISTKDDNFNPIYIDSEIYVVHYNIFGQIDKIINNYQNGLSNDEITSLINKNINKINENIPSLYFNKYLLVLNNSQEIVIINNTLIQKYLLKLLIFSLSIFILIELIIIYISKKITKWIIKPVEEAFQRQKQFIMDASHELKTPLAIISACSETLENNPEETKWLYNIKNECHRMNELVTSLLELSKTESLPEKTNFENINLSKLIKNKALSFESIIFEKGLSLETTIEENITFTCQSDKIKELLSILIDNAIAHSYKKSKITVSLSKEKNNIVLKVKNKGKEVPPSEREKIFERFYQIDKSRNHDSGRYGLGLSIAKNIVSNHSGNISVDCENNYTTFTIKFKQN